MNDLTSLIASEHLFQVEIQAESLQTLFSAFFKKMKFQDSRIEKLEEQLKNCIQKDEYDNHQSEIRARISQNENDIEDLNNKNDLMTKNLAEFETKLKNMIEERANDIMMTTTSSNEQAYSNITSTFELLQNSVQDFLKNQPKDNITERFEKIEANITELQTKLEESKQNEENFVNKEYIDGRLRDAVDEINRNVDRQFENYNNNVYNILEDESGNSNDRSIAAKLRIALAHLRTEFEEFKNGFGDKHKHLISNNVQPDAQSQSEQDTGDDFEIYQKNISRAMMAINNTMNNIIAEGAGLGKIPFLQLAQNAPAIFMDNFVAIQPDKVGDRKIPKISGLTAAPSKRTTEKIIIGEEKKKTGLTQEDIQTISLRIASELKIEDVKARMDEIEKQNIDVLSALDRKVDREFDERLFEKFRVYINQIKETVNNLSQQVENYATRDEVEEVKKIATGIPVKVIDQGPVVRKGPVCLFCGRPKTSITGSISPRTARKVGRAPVAVPTQSTDLVYGEGQAFVKGGETNSIQRFDTVLAATGQELDQVEEK